MLAGGNGALAEQFTEHLSSYDHAMFTSYAQWFMRALGGIRVADDAVAANRVMLTRISRARPMPPRARTKRRTGALRCAGSARPPELR